MCARSRRADGRTGADEAVGRMDGRAGKGVDGRADGGGKGADSRADGQTGPTRHGYADGAQGARTGPSMHGRADERTGRTGGLRRMGVLAVCR